MWFMTQIRFLTLTLSLYITLSICAPIIVLPDSLQNEHKRITAPMLDDRSLEERAINFPGKAPSSKAVQGAADAFAGDVAIVSSSLNGMGTTTDRAMIKKMATAGFNAETDEDTHRAVLFKAAGNDGNAANAKIVKNTPIVLDGLKSIMVNPSAANTMKQLNTMETARNSQILPSITSLSNAAFQNTGVQGTAQKFATTSGGVKAKQLQAGTKPAAAGNN